MCNGLGARSWRDVMDEEELVVVANWREDGRRSACHLGALQAIGFETDLVNAPGETPPPFLRAYVWCTDLCWGDLGHSCGHGVGPHRLAIRIPCDGNRPAMLAWLRAHMQTSPIL